MLPATIDATIIERSVDQRVILHGVGWDEYEAVLAMRGESSAVRIAYLQGALELMSPSRDHETLKTKLARIVEAYAEELGLDLEGYGSWTLKQRKEETGAEPDESYSLGPAGEVPDLAIEVVWTGGGFDKLEIYRCWEEIAIRGSSGASSCPRSISRSCVRCSTRRPSPPPFGS